MNDEICITKVKFGWLNQNPFNSMFGQFKEWLQSFLRVSLRRKIRKSGKKISMLVVHNQAEFTKKAVGRVTFSCLKEKNWMLFYKKPSKLEKDKLTMFLKEKDQKGNLVSKFAFTWSFKVKN